MNDIKIKISRMKIKIIAVVMVQTLFFANSVLAAEMLNHKVDLENLSPAMKLDAPSVRDFFIQAGSSEKAWFSGFNIEATDSNRQSQRLFNVTFVNDLAINPRLMSSLKESDFKQAMLNVFRSNATDLKTAYLKAVESFVILDENSSLDIQIMGEIANLILKDFQNTEIKLRAIKALAAIAIRQPQFKESIELLIVDCVNDRVSLAKKRNNPYHFLVFQARESLLEMGSDADMVSRLEPLGVELNKAVDYMRRVFLSMVNYINQDQKAKNKQGRVGRIYTKQNSFTDGLWLFGSDIDGLVIQLEDVSTEDMNRYERIFNRFFSDMGVAGAKDGDLERPYWKTSSAENFSDSISPSEIDLYDVKLYDDSGSDVSRWSPLKKGWMTKDNDFRTEKSKLRKLFLDLIDADKDSDEILDNFLVRDETILNASEKNTIKQIFNDPEKAEKVRQMLRRMHFIMGTNEVFYESHGQANMVVDDLYEALEFLKIMEKIADDSGDQFIRTRSILTWNNSKEFQVYPLWFMYTKGSRAQSTEGIKIVGRNSDRLIINDNNIFVLPIDENGNLADARSASLADVKAFVGANRVAVYDLQGKTITLIESDSFAYNMVESDTNLRLVFFDADGDISFLGKSKNEAEDFKSVIGQSNILANLLNKDRKLFAQDSEMRTDLIEPQVFSGFLNKNAADKNEENIMIIPSGEEEPILVSPERLAEYLGTNKQVIFDTASGKIILVDDTWTVNERIEQNSDYRYFFFDNNGDISLFVKNNDESEMFESIIRNSKMLSQSLDVNQRLIVKDIDTINDLKEPVEFFDLIGKAVLSSGDQTIQTTVSDVINSGPNRLDTFGSESIVTNDFWVDRAI